jgi:hypothetical protein
MSELIDVTPIRVACEEAIATGQFQNWSQLALACGCTRKDRCHNSGDVTNLKRRLGLKPSPFPLSYNRALRIINALGLDPVDFDL